MEQNAAVASKLSTRSRNLSQKRKSRASQGEGYDLSQQENSSWVPAGEHKDYQDASDEEEEEEAASEVRGRDKEAVAA